MEKSTKKLSLEPYKGTRDFYPEEQFVQNYIFSVMRKVVESYGYLEYGASILEETDLYKAKSGEEIVNDQTYSFTDRGGRNVTIRPEMPPTVARMVAQKRRELIFPLRWYSIPNLFRYERPQRGRLREHWQLNCDIFGAESVDADVEIIHLASDIMKAFGASEDNFEIRINDRRLMNYLLRQYLQLDDEQVYKVSKLIDRMHKINDAEFTAAVTAIAADKASLITEVLYIKSLDELAKKVPEAGAKALDDCFVKLRALGIRNFVYDPTLVRGFDYYTGIVFEVYDTSPINNRSLFGGGRYDDLVGIFDVEKITGVGFGMGDVTVQDFLTTYNLLPEYRPVTNLYIVPFNELFIDAANELAARLREQGLHVAVDLTTRKLPAKIKTADREKIPFVMVVGEEEVKSGIYKLKNLKDSKEFSVGEKEMITHIKNT